MKEVTENGQVYCVSDGYPKKPYIKYAKARGDVSEIPVGSAIEDSIGEIKDKVDAVLAAVDAVDKKVDSIQKV